LLQCLPPTGWVASISLLFFSSDFMLFVTGTTGLTSGKPDFLMMNTGSFAGEDLHCTGGFNNFHPLLAL
jgi:hypothetical protein